MESLNLAVLVSWQGGNMRGQIRGAVLGTLTMFIFATASTPALGHGGDEYGPGYGRGYDMGPGMMGYGGYGYGMGPGMMGPGYGMGYDMGPGMMGYGGYGYGTGPGMMGTGPIWMLNLNAAQRSKIAQIQNNAHKKNWALMGQMIDQQGALEQLYATDTPDPKKVGEVYGKIFQLRRQMIENGVEARNQMLAVLTKEQRQQLDQFWAGGGVGRPGGPRGPYPGMGRGMMD
jgi:Spy/CpxP family protein refolding chaperone